MRMLQAIPTSMKNRRELHQCHSDEFFEKVSSAGAGRVPRGRLACRNPSNGEWLG